MATTTEEATRIAQRMAELERRVLALEAMFVAGPRKVRIEELATELNAAGFTEFDASVGGLQRLRRRLKKLPNIDRLIDKNRSPYLYDVDGVVDAFKGKNDGS